MSTRTLHSVDEYLGTSYRPDRDFVDGEVVERNVGERDHGRIQKALLLYFAAREQQSGIECLPEQRVQISPSRFRVPDVCVVVGRAPKPVLTEPPFLCIEILSPEDRWPRMQQRINDYLTMGVPHVWVIDPAERRAYEITNAGTREVRQVLRTVNPTFEVSLDEIFASLD